MYFSGLSFPLSTTKKKKSFQDKKKMGSIESHFYEETGRWEEDYLALKWTYGLQPNNNFHLKSENVNQTRNRLAEYAS